MQAKTETIARALEGLTPEGFTKKSLVERYTEANLYEKIWTAGPNWSVSNPTT